ncbi:MULTISPECIES: succinate dehydrogenase [Acidiplasma]|uniref:Succinate dehydrogenase n=2 Tax=Acidiplasma aeolicum TaxID=507754 RepID=A0A0Q0WGR9_9ARCH|nr:MULTISPECIES: succinate dehydrogenase [Acidiplasma]KQB34654.1 succinate dehydrogenase [Acidiplasma aeolicum]WMT55394.1 MAG: succinate dehydrogenase [Acidiplasma sp.]
MNNKNSNGLKGLGPLGWLLQVITGVFLIFFLGIHLYLANIDFGHPIRFFTAVLENLHNGYWLAFYIVFTYIVLYHGLNGVRGILYDRFDSQKSRALIKYSLSVLYVVTAIYGTLLALAVSRIAIP